VTSNVHGNEWIIGNGTQVYIDILYGDHEALIAFTHLRSWTRNAFWEQFVISIIIDCAILLLFEQKTMSFLSSAESLLLRHCTFSYNYRGGWEGEMRGIAFV
jgi:hypothetical protein